MQSEREPYELFSAVFSQKPAVSAKRISILRAINKSAESKMRFRDIFRDVQAALKDTDYTSEKLTYDLGVLKDYALISKTWDGDYTISESGCSLLDMYQEMARRLGGPKRIGKTGFKGEVNGQIKAANFDLYALGEGLARMPLFRKKLMASKGTVHLELKDDDDNFTSDIEIQENGSFSISVVLFKDNSNIRKDFLGDFENTEEWCETAKAITQMIYYYIKRLTRKLWSDAKTQLLAKPDAFSI